MLQEIKFHFSKMGKNLRFPRPDTPHPPPSPPCIFLGWRSSMITFIGTLGQSQVELAANLAFDLRNARYFEFLKINT